MIPIGFVIDTWVWVEYYLGKDSRVNEYIENDSADLFTSTITLTEMIKFLHQEGEDSEDIRTVVSEIGGKEPRSAGNRTHCYPCR
ncbi:MAG: hypothetical protein M0Q92_12525 [Methanoregula sp.]|jgi:predicted nucleic acid-binding protein|nr:hypothetical protein [Methanoregula sp.]